MERSFKSEVKALRLGDGAEFHGEGILAVTKALLQSGVSYVGGYQGAPVSHLLDVLVDAQDIMSELGVHLETCTNEASAAAMLGASINYPLRGAVTWKSIVGTNVAADALSNLASPGVIGGAMIIIGEDYGEGASVIQERSYAYAMKSSMWLIDPRPDLPTIVRCVEEGFALSEASHAPVMLELRIRACHVTGSFAAKNNRAGAYSGQQPPPRAAALRLRAACPSAGDLRARAAQGREPDAGGAGVHPRAQAQRGRSPAISTRSASSSWAGSRTACCARWSGSASPMSSARRGCRCWCSTSSIRWCRRSCARSAPASAPCSSSRKAIPNTSSRRSTSSCAAPTSPREYSARGRCPRPASTPPTSCSKALRHSSPPTRPAGIDADAIAEKVRGILGRRARAAAALGELPARPPAFCTGCPERPVFSALKLVQRELGPTHISADIGCHSFATMPPFGMGNSILGYGMSLASAAAVGPNMAKRPIAVMGDGGFWHNGLITGVASNLFNKGDGVLVVMQNGYTSATGQQFMPSSPAGRDGAPGMDVETTLRAMGVTWLRKVRTYGVAKMVAALREALSSAERGLKVIIADGECQLVRQRRVRAQDAAKLARGGRVVTTRYGVDEAICTGDHSCIRLSGCPSLTVKPNPTRCAAIPSPP